MHIIAVDDEPLALGLLARSIQEACPEAILIPSTGGATGMTPEEAAQAAVDAVRELSIRVGIPQHLSEIGITEADIPALAAQAITDVCTPGNPRDVTEAEIIELYKKVL